MGSGCRGKWRGVTEDRAGAASASWADGYALDGGRVLVGNEIVDALGEHPDVATARRLGGSFAAVLRRRQAITIVSDRFGSRPVFYARSPLGWIVDRDPWAVARATAARRPDPVAAVELLAYKYAFGNHTLIPGVTEAPPASVVTLGEGGERTERYWRYVTEPRRRSGRELVTELGQVFETMAGSADAVGRAIGLERWGANLTAGRDSRVIAAGLAANGASFECFSSDIEDDAVVAEQLARLLEVSHRRIASWAALGSPWVPRVADPLAATTMVGVAGHPLALAATGASGVSGWVSGHLGDNFVGGQLSLRLHAFRRRPRSDLVTFLVHYHRALSPGDLRSLLRPEWRELADAPDSRFRALCDEADADEPFGVMVQVDLEQRKRRHILRDHFALEQLGPTMLWFADPAWSDFWATVPPEWQIGTPLYSRTLREQVFVGALGPLADVPANGVRLRSVRLPRPRARLDDIARRSRKRIGRRSTPSSVRADRVPAQDLEAAAWLVDPDVFAQDRPYWMVQAVRTIARATALLDESGTTG